MNTAALAWAGKSLVRFITILDLAIVDQVFTNLMLASKKLSMILFYYIFFLF